MIETRLLLPLALLTILISTSSCSFHRVIVNEHLKNQDVSWIRLGESTWIDVLKRLGPPENAAAPRENIPKLSPGGFKYTCYDTKTTELILQYIVMIPFRWRDIQPAYELLVEFDEHGRVSRVTKSEGDAIWKPLTSESGRVPPRIQVIAEGSIP